MENQNLLKCVKHNKLLDFFCTNSECACEICEECLEKEHFKHGVLKLSRFIENNAETIEKTIFGIKEFIKNDKIKTDNLQLVFNKTQGIMQENTMKIRKRLTVFIEKIIENFKQNDIKNLSKLSMIHQKFINDHNKNLFELRNYANSLLEEHQKLINHNPGKIKLHSQAELLKLTEFSSNSNYENIENEYKKTQRNYENNNDLDEIIKKLLHIDNVITEKEFIEKIQETNKKLTENNTFFIGQISNLYSLFSSNLEELNWNIKNKFNQVSILLDELNEKLNKLYSKHLEKIPENLLLKHNSSYTKPYLLYEFILPEQIFGDADGINKERFIKNSPNYGNCMFHFDSKRTGLFVGFDMSMNPKIICAVKISTETVSHNLFDVQYSHDAENWQSAGQILHIQNIKFEIDIPEAYNFWRIVVLKHAGNTPWYNIEWYYQ